MDGELMSDSEVNDIPPNPQPLPFIHPEAPATEPTGDYFGDYNLTLDEHDGKDLDDEVHCISSMLMSTFIKIQPGNGFP
jgi:hypothetical protein